MACNNACTATCSGICADNCAIGCSGNCSDSCEGTCVNKCTSCVDMCGASCDYQCINDCGKNCATICVNDCTNNCDNGCKNENHISLFNSIKDINPRTLFEASNIQVIADLIRLEAIRRKKPAKDTEDIFNKQKKLTAEDINKVILNLRRSHQWIPFVQSKEKATSSLAQRLISGVEAAYWEKMFPEAPEIIYLYNNRVVLNPDNSNDPTDWLDWGNDQTQLTWSAAPAYDKNNYIAGQKAIDENTYYLFVETTTTPGLQRASIYTVDTIDFSKYKDYYLCVQFKSITFARGSDSQNINVGFEGLGITTTLGNKDVFFEAKSTSTLGIYRPDGPFGDTYLTTPEQVIQGACKVSDLMTNPSNGHLYFIVVRPNMDKTQSPQMQINKIWLQTTKPDWLVE